MKTQFLDEEGLIQYDELIKNYINSQPNTTTWENIENKPDDLAYTDDIAKIYQSKNIGISTDELDEWTKDTACTMVLWDVTYGNNTFIAVGFDGYAYYSVDGINWTSSDSTISNNLKAIIYENNMFITVGESGATYYSLDGIDWYAGRTCGSNMLNNITYGNNIYVIVGDKGVTYHSTDGINWSEGGTCDSNDLSSVIYANNIFVATSDEGVTYHSTDGINWSKGGTCFVSGGILHDVTYVNDTFIAVGSVNNGVGDIFYSADGINWTVGNNVSGNKGIYNIIHDGNMFIAVGNKAIYCSTDGINWTEDFTCDDSLRAVAYGNDTFVAVGVNGITYATKYIKEQKNLEDTINELFSNSSNAAYISSDSEAVEIETPIELTRNDIVDNLVTEDTTKVLSATQGKVLNDNITNILGDLASKYDSTSTYAIDDYVIYNGYLYKCTTAITTPEEFDSSKWTQTDCGTEFNALNFKLDKRFFVNTTLTAGDLDNITISGAYRVNSSTLNMPSGAKETSILLHFARSSDVWTQMLVQANGEIVFIRSYWFGTIQPWKKITTEELNSASKISGINNGYHTRLTDIQNVDTSFVAPKNGVLRITSRAETDDAYIQVSSVGSFSNHAIYIRYLNALDYDCGEVILFEGQEVLIISSNMRSVTASFIDFI